jgi:hypothetical protein
VPNRVRSVDTMARNGDNRGGRCQEGHKES